MSLIRINVREKCHDRSALRKNFSSKSLKLMKRAAQQSEASLAGGSERVKLPEIGLSLFKRPLGEPQWSQTGLLRTRPLFSFRRLLPFARSGDPRERSRVGRWKRSRRRKRMSRKNALDGASAKPPPNCSLLEIAREKP